MNHTWLHSQSLLVRIHMNLASDAVSHLPNVEECQDVMTNVRVL